MGNVLGSLEPKSVWNFFEEITQIPRPSKKEEKIAAYIIDFAKKHGFEYKTDKLGNIVVRKPATPGMENRVPTVIQGHLDMVCEKNADVEFDFLTDPIQPWIDGDWVKAKGTTLGADNGIGLAMGLAVLASNDIPHPPMELLCTLDEETGLTGAVQLGTDLLNGRILINLDSEEDGAFTIGCAGGTNTSATFMYDEDAVPSGSVAYEVAIRGLQGGHSGIEIHDGRANAIKLLNRFLWTITKNLDVRISSIKAGSAHNAIPREAFAVVTLSPAIENQFREKVAEFDRIYKSEWQTKEKNISLTAETTSLPTRIMSKSLQKRLLTSIYAAPHGPLRYSPDIPGLVQTSTNLAIVETRPLEIFVLTSQRSSVETEKTDMANTVRSSFELGGAVVRHGDGYPAWQPNINSPILNTAIKIYKEMTGKEPKVEAIHAGLECGLIGEKYPGMDMLSFGPTLKEVHSPNEKVQISTVQNCWNLLVKILENIPGKN
jgi:dipeptidase D